MADPTSLLPLVRAYIERDPAGAARALEGLSEQEAIEVVSSLTPHLAARVVPLLQVSYAATLLKGVDDTVFTAVAKKLDAQRAATIFMHLPEDARERFLPHLPEKIKAEVQELATYPEDSVGRIMAKGFLSFPKDMSVRDTIKKLRARAKSKKRMSYAYIADLDGKLLGVLNMHDLLLAAPEAKLETIMRPDVFSLHGFTPVEDAAEELSKRRYFAAPVVDGQHRLVGIIKAEQLITGVQDEATEDIQRMFGAGRDERVFSPVLFALRKRLPWLHVNLATAFLAAGVVAFFESTIQKLTVLAVFLPVVAGQGGNAGAQSLAIVMRGLVMREIPRGRVGALIIKEGVLGSITGLVTGAVTGLVAWLWYGNVYLGLVIALGMVVNLICAGLAGASIPLIMKAVGLDPAQASSIILTTVTDVVGFFAFLGFAVVFIGYLT